MRINIQKVDNGYILTDSRLCGNTTVHKDITELFNELLMLFETRSKYFGGKLFGYVEVHTKPTTEVPEMEAA